jgi:hypothetical protein
MVSASSCTSPWHELPEIHRLVDSLATGGRQFNKQYRIQKVEDGAIDVAVDVLKKS